MNQKKHPDRRQAARDLAMQALYRLHMNHDDASVVEAQFLADQDFKNADKRLFRNLLYGVAEQAEQLDSIIEVHLDRPLKTIDPIEMTILRIGAFELSQSVSVPYRVAINVCVELGKIYGATDGHKYINGILDKLAAQYRQVEIAANHSK